MKFVERATRVLNKRKFIKAISKLAQEKVGSEISIGFPMLGSERCNIYFVVDTPNLNTGELTREIKNLLDFDYADSDEKDGVVIFNRALNSPQTISTIVDVRDITPFTPDKYDDIHAFLKNHYHPDLPKDDDVDTRQDKKRRSVSPSSSSSLFSQNGGHLRVESEQPLTAEMLVRYLQQNPRVWEGIKRSPEVLDEAFGRAKRVLIEEQTPSSRLAGSAK